MAKFIDRLLDPDAQQEEGQRQVNLRRLPGWVGWIVIVLIVGIYLASGIYTISPSEEGLVKRFGRYVRTVDPGLHYHLPTPFESVVVVNILEVRKSEIGFRTISPAPNPRYQTIETEALMLTGDGNIAHVEMVVQYRVNDSSLFAFNLINSATIVKQAAEAADAIQALSASSEAAAESALQIAASSQQQLVGVDQVATAMDSIKQATTQNLDSMRQLDEAAQSLKDMSEELVQTVEQYKL